LRLADHHYPRAVQTSLNLHARINEDEAFVASVMTLSKSLAETGPESNSWPTLERFPMCTVPINIMLSTTSSKLAQRSHRWELRRNTWPNAPKSRVSVLNHRLVSHRELQRATSSEKNR